jgi:hypothetical protein
MNGQDPEIEQLKAGLNCAALLERIPPVWRLDRGESTRHALKYRRGDGEVLIVNHEGRGWWDPQSERKGDVFSLVQYLEPGLNFGEVRRVLRPFVGISPTFPEALRNRKRAADDLSIPERWSRRPILSRFSRAWRYLTEIRCLPAHILASATTADIVRSGPYGSAWFAHRDDNGRVSHVEIRGPAFKGSLSGGTKTLFRVPGGSGTPRRIVIAEAPIDALSTAAMEDIRRDTLYLATGGGMGPETIAAIDALLRTAASVAGAQLCSATDNNPAGERYAARHRALADAAGVAFERLRPPIAGGDWNDVLKQGRGR